MMNKLYMVEQAKYFAIGCHGTQKRKYTNNPYWTHCQTIVEILKQFYPNVDAYIVGWLHDVVEDTWVSCFDIETHFNSYIAQCVSFLTMPSKDLGNRKLRMDFYNQRLSESDELVQTVKYADLLHNTVSIEYFDPDFAKVYLAEKRELLPLIDKGEPRLYEKVCKQCGL